MLFYGKSVQTYCNKYLHLTVVMTRMRFIIVTLFMSLRSSRKFEGKNCFTSDLITGSSWFNPRLGKYSFRGLMIVIATGFILLSPLSFVSKMVLCKCSQKLGKNVVQSTGKKNSRKACIGARAAAI